MGKLLENRSQFGTICNTRSQHITAAKPQATPNRSDQGLRQNSGMDRPAVIQTYGKVWITCVLVWIGGMDRRVGSGYGSGLYILIHSRRFRLFLHAADAHAGTQACTQAHRHAGTHSNCRQKNEQKQTNKPNKQTKQTNKQKNKKKNKQTNKTKQTNRQTDKPTNRQTDKPTNRKTDKPTNRLTNKHRPNPKTNVGHLLVREPSWRFWNEEMHFSTAKAIGSLKLVEAEILWVWFLMPEGTAIWAVAFEQKLNAHFHTVTRTGTHTHDTHLLRNILSSYWSGMHHTCKKHRSKPDRNGLDD